MRVLLLTDWTANEGGIEAYVTRVSDGLRADGHDVCLLTSSVGSAADGTAEYVAFGTDNAAAQTLLQIANPFAVSRVRKAVGEFRPDVALVNMFEKYLSPAIFHALGAVPTVAFVHYYKPICPTALKVLPSGSLCTVPAGLVCWRAGCVGLPEWLRDRPRYALIRSGFRRADQVLACSHWVADQLHANGIDAEPLALPVPPPARGFARAPASDPVFVYAGRLDRAKGSDLLLRAFARLHSRYPSARLRIVGGGQRLAALRSLAVALGIGDAVEFLGPTSFEGVEAAFADAWALVAPSVWPEPLGLVAIEAITRGLPVIASAAGGFAETVEEGVSGTLVPNGSEHALVEALVATAEAPMTVPPNVARALQSRHDSSRHVARLTGVFRDALELQGKQGRRTGLDVLRASQSAVSRNRMP